MTSLVKRSEVEVLAFVGISAAIVVTLLITYILLRAAKIVLTRLGPHGIDARTRIVGFFLPWAWG